MLTQTLAIFHDAYRELNARKMFWIVLILSALFAGSFGLLGIDERGLMFLRWRFMPNVNTSLVPREVFYKGLFTYFGISIWLTWAATILALISTAGIFPELITSGSIDLFVSKPISRARLFLTKYAAGLLFVALQVTLFCAASVLVIGLRGGVWEPSLFLAVPIVILFYSYLFAICVLVGVVTRSTVAAILLTILFWFFVLGIHAGEMHFLEEQVKDRQRVESAERDIAKARKELEYLSISTATAELKARRVSSAEGRLAAAQTRKADASENSKAIHNVFYAAKWPLPKTSETVALLDRWLVKAAHLKPKIGDDDGGAEDTDGASAADRDAAAAGPHGLFGRSIAEMRAEQEVARIVSTRSVSWIIGTSLGFEGVMLLLAGWVFCRRDY